MFDNISYEKLIKLDEIQYEEVLSLQNNKQKIIKIANECLLNLEKNILKNYSLLICINKVCPFKENKIFDSKKLEEIFDIFKKEFLEYKKNSGSYPISKRYQNNKKESKIDNYNTLSQYETIEKRLEFLKLIIKVQAELKQYNILKEILKYHLFLNQEQMKSIIIQFIDAFIEREELFNKEEIKLFEYLILEFNYLESNLDYRIKEIKYDDFNYEIKLNKEVENIKYLNEFICSFSKQKDKDVIEEMKIFIFNFFNSTNLNLLFKKCDDYLNESSDTSNIIDLCKYAINNSEKNYVLKIKSLSSLCKKAIFKFTVKLDNKEKDLYFYGNTRINEINNYLNNNLKEFKNNDNEYFMLEYKDDKNNISLDEYDSNKTLNELNNYFDKSKKGKLEIIKKEIITKEELLDSNNNLTERFNLILTNWFKIFSKGKDKTNLEDIADWFTKLSGKKKPFFSKSKLEIIQFLKENSNVLEITLDEFKAFYKKAIKDDINDIINNLKNMNFIIEIPQEIENNKLPRYYLSNKIDEYKESYLYSKIFENYIFSLNEDVFDFISSLSVNENRYNNILNNFSKNDKNFTQRTFQYINNMYTLYIIESIIEDVEIINSKDILINIKEGQKENIQYKNIYSQKSNSFDDENNIDKKNQFFIDFINNKYSDLVKYSSLILKRLNEDKESGNNNNIMIRCCIKCLDIINNIYNSYHDINSKIDNNRNIINIKYKALKNIIEKKKLSKNITDKSIYEGIIIQIIKYIDKCCYKFANKNQGENNGIISKLKENCYILLFSLLYTNKEIFEIINKNEEIKKLFDKILKDLYLIDYNKKYFGLLFITIFKQIEDKISDEFLSYLNDLIFIVFQEYIKSDKKKIENGFISIHFKLLINYGCNKDNLKVKLEDNFKKICDMYYIFINHKNRNGKINGGILNNIIQNILLKYLDLKSL